MVLQVFARVQDNINDITYNLSYSYDWNIDTNG